MYTETSSTIAEGTGRGMWSFQYKHGDRPLEGYTIQRAAGRGGFGEVYYAISDAGREVALKVITGFEQIELRGISQCMNLKSPHLVTIFDVRQNPEGRSFVIMEFVSGLNLRELLDQSPAGLGTQKAAFFLREIAKGLSYLHDCGIVHRDLKPANIFYENGYVKIGDYGLSKAIAPTHHSGQTVTVGTVHYMAPEVGCGKYDRSIDIYALGALLYEMLTGVVPFVGASAGEILIKHLSHDADCTGIPEPFCTAIRKAMAKDPVNRYATVQEMVEAVFGAEHVRNSVSQFAPQELSMIAERVAGRISSPIPRPVIPPPIIANTSSSVTAPNGLGTPGGAWAAGYVSGSALHTGRRITETLLKPFSDSAPPVDPFSLGQRVGLGVVATFVIATCAVIFSGSRNEPETWFFTALAIIGGSLGIALVGRKWLPWRRAENHWMDRFTLGGAGAGCAIILAGIVWVDSHEQAEWAGPMFLAVLAGLGVANPRRWVRGDRKERVNFGWPAAAGAIAFAVSVMAGDNDCNPAVAIAIAGGIALIVQMLTPWNEKAAAARTDNDDDDDETGDAKTRYTQPAAFPGAAPRVGAMPGIGAIPPLPPMAPWSDVLSSPWNAIYPPKPRPYRMPVPRGMLIALFCLMVLTFAIGLAFFVPTMVNGPRDGDFVTTLSFALTFFSISMWAFIRLCHRTLTSWGLYLIMPLARLGCFIGALVAFIHFANTRRPWENDYIIPFAIFSTLWLLMWVVPFLWRMAIPTNGSPASAGPTPPPGSPAPQPAGTPEITPESTNAPAAVRTSSYVSPPAPSQPPRARRRERDVITFIANLAGGLILTSAFIFMLSIAIDVPQMVAAGVPDQSLADELRRDVFGQGVEDWPALVRNIVSPISLILFFAAGACLLIARRRRNGWHLLRGLVGVVGFAFACTPLAAEFASKKPWHRLSDIPSFNRSGWTVVQVFVDTLQGGAILFGFMLLASLALLLWPSRPAVPRDQEVAI
jgi:serine/threonine protein kinase